MSSITIAGITFRFSIEDVNVDQAGTHHWISSAFSLQATGYSAVNEVKVRITGERAPEYADGKKFFESGDSWTGYQKGECFYLVEHHPETFETVNVTVVEPKMMRVSIHCGTFILEQLRCGRMTHPFTYPLDQILTGFFLADLGGTVVHSAGWIKDGRVWLFPGKSGAGKSTTARMIKQHARGTLLSDDRVALRKHGVIKAYGTPWAGEEGDALNTSAPLDGLFFLEQGSRNAISRIEPFEAFRRIAPVLSIPWYNGERVKKAMAFVDEIVSKVPSYRFTFTRERQAVEVLLGHEIER